MRILLVDDDAMSRELWRMLLEAEGHAVEAAAAGEEALVLLERAMQSTAPEIVLTDMQMPGICGAEFAQALKAVCGTLLLLAMSGSQPHPDALRGFNGFLLKPFTIEAFEEAIRAALDRQTEGHAPKVYVTEVSEQGSLTSHPEEDAGGLDEAIYNRLNNAMPMAKVQELYTLCLSDAKQRIQSMHEAFDAGNDTEFRSAAHAIKGGCGMIGAIGLKALAGELEEAGLSKGNPGTKVTLEQFMVTCEKFERMLSRRWVCE